MKEVNQFPSDIECMRYIATIADKVRMNFIFFIDLFLIPAIFGLLELVKIFAEM